MKLNLKKKKKKCIAGTCVSHLLSLAPCMTGTIIEPHGRGVPEAVLNGRSPHTSLHSGRLVRGEQPLSTAAGTPCRGVLFLLHPLLYNISIITPNFTENMTNRCVPHNIGIVRAVAFVYIILCADWLIMIT